MARTSRCQPAARPARRRLGRSLELRRSGRYDKGGIDEHCEAAHGDEGNAVRKVYLRPSTEIAALCLFGGLLFLFMLSGPAITRRGYPEIDPWMLALPWLWPVPILLAAPFRRTPHLKDWVMLAYCAGAAAVLFGAFGSVSVPRYMPPHAMLLFGIALSLPVRLFALPVEALGMLLLHSIGVRQADADLPPLGDAVPGEKVVRVWVYLAAVGVAAVAFPFVYHHVAVESARQAGARTAGRDWAAGEAWWPVMMDEPEWSPTAAETFDVKTGLPIMLVFEGLVEETWWESYRSVVRQKLAEYGPAPMVEYLLMEEEFRDFVAQGRFEPLDDHAFRFGDANIHADGTIGAPGVVLSGSPGRRYGAVLPEKGGVLVVIEPHGICVLHPDGRYIQSASYELATELYEQLEQERTGRGGAP
jgi:hypothetical protein